MTDFLRLDVCIDDRRFAAEAEGKGSWLRKKGSCLPPTTLWDLFILGRKSLIWLSGGVKGLENITIWDMKSEKRMKS